MRSQSAQTQLPEVPKPTPLASPGGYCINTPEAQCQKQLVSSANFKPLNPTHADMALTYKELIYYKIRFKKLYLELEFINNDIEFINKYKQNNYSNQEFIIYNSCCSRLFCCKPAKSINYKL